MTDKERYNYRKRNGLCCRCGKPKGNVSTTRCDMCKQDEEKTIEYYKKHHICIDCRTNDALPNRCCCYECQSKRLETYRKTKDNKTEEEKIEKNKQSNERRKERVKFRKENGLCPRCGKKALPGHVLCIDCNLKNNRDGRERRAKQHGPKRPNECLRCSNQKLPGRQLCAKHYEQAVKALEKGRNSVAFAVAHKKYSREKIDMFWSEMKYYGKKKSS